MKEVVLPYAQEDPTDPRGNQGPQYNRARPAPDVGSALLHGEYEEYRCHGEQRVNKKINLGD